MKQKKQREVTTEEIRENDAALIKKFGAHKFENDYEPGRKGHIDDSRLPDYLQAALEEAEKRHTDPSD